MRSGTGAVEDAHVAKERGRLRGEQHGLRDDGEEREAEQGDEAHLWAGARVVW